MQITLIDIITCLLIFVMIDVLWMIIVLYRAFVLALASFLNSAVEVPLRSRLSILMTVSSIYLELVIEDPIEALVYMPMYSAVEPNLGAELFSSPFIKMLNEGLIYVEDGDDEDPKE